VDTVRDPLLVLDCTFNVATASRSFLREFDVISEKVVRHSVYEILDGHFNVVGLAKLIENALTEHTVSEKFEINSFFPGIGQRIFIVGVSEVLLPQNSNKAILLSFHDVTQRRLIENEKADLLANTQKLLEEKRVLLLEMRHRIFNSLQIIANILMMKTRATASQETRKHLEDAYARVMSVATIQRHIDDAARTETVKLAPYFTKICESLAHSMIDDEWRASVRYQFDDASVASAEAVSLGLILTELVINSLKYGFPTNRADAEVVVKFETSGTNWRLTVSDNGVGRPHDGAGSGDGLGSTLVKALAQQVKAQIETVNSEHGLTVAITHATFTSRPA